ncbi:hypothetical protein M0R04_06875 [Candidatus Dojkabacteria bacterium]|jgi:hypothetical protein|nr:hypothetical protein [Candidatus Dojkabacteria bacterium]
MIFYGVELAAGTVAQNMVLEGFTNVTIPGIVTPQAGRLIFNSDSKLVEFYDGTQWSSVGGYSLPIASDTVLGGIKVGSGLAIDGNTGVLSVPALTGSTLGKTWFPRGVGNANIGLSSVILSGVITGFTLNGAVTTVLLTPPPGVTHCIVHSNMHVVIDATPYARHQDITGHFFFRKNASESWVEGFGVDTNTDIVIDKAYTNNTNIIGFDTTTNSFQYQVAMIPASFAGPYNPISCTMQFAMLLEGWYG